MRVIYPGSFDPMTKGHQNIVEQALYLFDEVIIAVLNNPSKHNNFFTIEERVEIIRELYDRIDKVKVVTFNGALVDLAALYECKTIIRGIRSLTDTDYEIQLAQTNNELSEGKVRTLCLFPDNEFQYLSSSKVRSIYGLDKSVEKYLDPLVNEKVLMKRSNSYG